MISEKTLTANQKMFKCKWPMHFKCETCVQTSINLLLSAGLDDACRSYGACEQTFTVEAIH